MKNKKGITLIALVITIIILIILAGVAINLSIGENGIFRKAKYAKEQYTEQVLREKIELEITNLEIESLTTGEEVTIDKVLETLLEKGIFESIDKEAGTGKAGEYEIKFKYDSNNNVIIEYVEQSIGKLKVTYTVEPENYIKEGTMTITLKVVGKVKSITKPDGLIIYPKIEQVGLDYDVTANGTYKFIIEDEDGKKIEKEVTVDKIDKLAPKNFEIKAASIREKIIITANAEDAEADGVSVKSGISRYEYFVKKESEANYTRYDTNQIEGLEYGTYSIYVIAYDKAGNSKQSNTVTIQKVQEILVGENAFDNDYESYETIIRGTKRIYIEQEQWGEIISINMQTSYGREENSTSIYFYDLEGQKIDGVGKYFYQEGGTTITNVFDYTIPQNCSYIEFWAGDGSYNPYIYIYEIQYDTYVNIVKKGYLEPILKGNTIQQEDATIELVSGKNVKKVLYKIDENEWIEYTGIFKIPNNVQTLYVKGIDKNGNDTMIVKSIQIQSGKLLNKNAYDNNLDTCSEINKHEYARLYIDSSAYGKTININLKTMYGTGDISYESESNSTAIYFYDLDGQKIEGVGTYFYQSGGTTATGTYTYTIPQNCSYIEFWVGSGTSIFNPYMYIYEITVE